MSTSGILSTILLTTQLTACGTYTVASTGLWVATGRSASDWVATGVTRGDCRTTHVIENKYFCEMPVVYNSAGL